MKGKECLGADTLMKLLKNYTRNKNIKTTITVGVVGYPNVGKSSLINSLKREKVVGVGATPGVTKVKQEIYLDKNIRLLDCPGIVFATKDTTETGILLRSNAIKVQQITDLSAAVELIVRQVPKEKLMTLYAIADFKDSREFLGHIATKRGKMKRGGVPNFEEAARTIIQDWNSGIVPFYTVPPPLPAASSAMASSDLATPSSTSSSAMIDEEGNAAAIVTQWAKEFDIDALLQDEEGVLDGACSAKAGEQLQGKESAVDATMLCEDETEDDVAMDSAVQIEVGAIKKRKKSTDAVPTESVVGQNKLIKQEQKKKKKKESGEGAAPMQGDDGNDEYSFASDFFPHSRVQDESDDDDDDGDDGEGSGEEEGSDEEGGEISGAVDLD
jgi:nuclear GTP-binding protein